MWQKPRDTANTWEQRSWVSALHSHGIYKKLENSANAVVAKHSKEQLARLETEYPQLAKAQG